jgi:hypothetical protein
MFRASKVVSYTGQLPAVSCIIYACFLFIIFIIKYYFHFIQTIALDRNPQGYRKTGRLKRMSRKTIEDEIKQEDHGARSRG